MSADLCILLTILSDAITSATMETSSPGRIVGREDREVYMNLPTGENYRVPGTIWITTPIVRPDPTQPLRGEDFISKRMRHAIGNDKDCARIIMALARFRHERAIAGLMCRIVALCKSLELEMHASGTPIEAVGLWQERIQGTTRVEAVRTGATDDDIAYVSEGRTLYSLAVTLKSHAPDDGGLAAHRTLFMTLTGDMFGIPAYAPPSAHAAMGTTQLPIPLSIVRNEGIMMRGEMLSTALGGPQALWPKRDKTAIGEGERAWMKSVWRVFRANAKPYLESIKPHQK